ncbi:hypothetical protein RJZ56_001748 [Blastomyces dermatitidis]|uniref:EKC/KEOPS complex subunit BUD32 n=1 Tax=Ajellomyces dermatitidis (strain ER-3 / ATCC MYA-2586) TaxID=559297 RepID=A0ABP2EZM5_AJEDR|nr:serine/threonine-protein kinase Sgk2 [Blastomyces dermatitidis ER-3]EEQ89759.2 serine/threonine-protein kinase Sgk2 [Blastomyces dermatitidis ER-3]EQL37998.1 hypothetical protein BDFG_01015 [Blastomyces dermatitidis ATCC 26199]
MDSLSGDDLSIISKHPFNDSLHRLHKYLQESEHYCNDKATDDSEYFQDAISKLLTTLMGERSAFNLRSPASNQDVASELSGIFRRLRSGDFSYEDYRPLVRLILQKASDIDIWKTVFDLIVAVSRCTPLPTVPPTSQATPLRSTSSSQQGKEQTRELVELRIFDEIKTCTYRVVEGFDAKYFQGKDWEEGFSTIYERVLQRGHDEVEDFPDPPTEEDVLEWLFGLQERFFAETRGYYYKKTIKKKDLTGSEAERQLDFLMKRRKNENKDTRHDWKDIHVIGELKQPDFDKGTLLQMERYVRDVFAAQPTRRFVHSFTLCGSEMELWVTDRSGPYSSGPFDIRRDPKRFFRAMIGYTLMSDEELGLDVFTTLHDDGCRTVSISDADSGRKQLRLQPKPIAVQSAVVCRGTCCFLANRPGIPNSDGESVVKFSWMSARRRPEVDLLRLAHQRGVKGVAKVIGQGTVTSIAELRDGLSFGEPYPFRGRPALSVSSSFSLSQPQSQQSQSITQLQGLSLAKGSSSGSSRKRKSRQAVGAPPLKRSRSSKRFQDIASNDEVSFDVEAAQKTSLVASTREGPFDNRIFRCLAITPAGRAIHQFTSAKELLLALRDAIKAHRSLYLDGKILHRDISENNIIITNPDKADGYHGMLIDLDLAKERDKGRTGARQQTGTMEFMAIEVLDGTDHTYRHDLESFLYVLIWQCARHGWRLSTNLQGRPKVSRLAKWYTGSYDDIARIKASDMGAKRFENLLVEFPPEFEEVKSLCRDVRKVLFRIYKDDIFTGTPVKSEVLYDPIIQAFDRAITLNNAKI